MSGRVEGAIGVVVSHGVGIDVWCTEPDEHCDYPRLHIVVGDDYATGVMIHPAYPEGPPWPTGPQHVQFAEELANAAAKYRDEVKRLHEVESPYESDTDHYDRSEVVDECQCWYCTGARSQGDAISGGEATPESAA